MFQVVVSLAIIAVASAFAPVSRVARSSALTMNFENALGAQPPLGFWDPLGLLAEADQARFDRLREVEVKHGRISMLAILGHFVTASGARLAPVFTPGRDLSDYPAGVAALSALPFDAIFGTFIFVGLIELGYGSRKDEIAEAQLTASGWDAETINKKLAIELNNGRAAQMGILGLMVHEKLDNNPYIINSILGFPVDFNAGF